MCSEAYHVSGYKDTWRCEFKGIIEENIFELPNTPVYAD